MENYHDFYIRRLVDELESERGDNVEGYAVKFQILFMEHDVPMEELDEIYNLADERLNVYDSGFSRSAKKGVMRAIERIRKG